MENNTLLPHSSNVHSQTPLHNPTIHVNQTSQAKAMKIFQGFVFKLAETHPNEALTPAAKTLLHGRLNQFVSEYKTPDHPPYSAMIEKALQELNEKRGSSEESISQYLEKRYDNLPSSHSLLLKHHLEKLCESGEIVVTCEKRYGLPGCLNFSTEVKRKSRRRWRWDCDRLIYNRHKKKLSKKKNQQKCEKDEVTEMHREYEERDQQLTENGAHSGDKCDQTKRLLSRVIGENGAASHPSFLLTEPSGMTSASEKKKYSEEVRPQQLEIGPSGIVKVDIPVAQNQEQQEREQSEYSQPELSSPERPPGFELIVDENLTHSGSTELELASAEEFIGSKRTQRQLKRWSRRLSEPKPVTLTSPDTGEYHPTNCQRLQVLLNPKPDEANVENFRVMGDCRGQDLKQSGKPADFTSICEKMEPPQTLEVVLLSNTKQTLQEMQPAT